MTGTELAHATRDPLPGRFGLIVCRDVLYYAGELEDLAAVARKLTGALEPGGYLLTAHAHVVATCRTGRGSTGTSRSAPRSSARRSPQPSPSGW